MTLVIFYEPDRGLPVTYSPDVAVLPKPGDPISVPGCEKPRVIRAIQPLYDGRYEVRLAPISD